jgi:hypothetical protein
VKENQGDGGGDVPFDDFYPVFHDHLPPDLLLLFIQDSIMKNAEHKRD